MAGNDKIILDGVLEQLQSSIDPLANPSDFFEFFTAEQVLKDFDLSYDEIDTGLVGAGGDGGIDGIYLFVNGELVQEDPDYAHLKTDITLHLIILQSKTRAGFQETPVERFLTFSDNIFDLARDPIEFDKIYNAALIEAIKRFRAVHMQLVARFPTFRISYNYASKGASPPENVKKKVGMLEANVKKHFPSAEFRFTFLGAAELLDLARRSPQTTYPLVLAENPISSEGQVGFVCLVRLRDFYKFITDEEGGSLRRQIFDANVRDYAGRTEVNDDIQKSLQETTAEDFWWLNNGVSVLASKASLGGKTLTIENPQIVNGLQTSTEIYNYFRKCNTENEDRKILVRVVVPEEGESRDRIIKATNSQTVVQLASLRATDKIHRDIEQYLRSKGLFYDRRKNYYKNEGKPRDKIVAIPHLAQSVMAILLRRPDTARGRPSSLLKKDEDYVKVFSERYPIQMYYVCVAITQRVEKYLKSSDAALDAKDRNNLRFYVAMHIALSLCGNQEPSATDLARIEVSTLDTAKIKKSTEIVERMYNLLGRKDEVAKGPALLDAVKKKL